MIQSSSSQKDKYSPKNGYDHPSPLTWTQQWYNVAGDVDIQYIFDLLFLRLCFWMRNLRTLVSMLKRVYSPHLSHFEANVTLSYILNTWKPYMLLTRTTRNLIQAQIKREENPYFDKLLNLDHFDADAASSNRNLNVLVCIFNAIRTFSD